MSDQDSVEPTGKGANNNYKLFLALQFEVKNVDWIKVGENLYIKSRSEGLAAKTAAKRWQHFIKEQIKYMLTNSKNGEGGKTAATGGGNEDESVAKAVGRAKKVKKTPKDEQPKVKKS